MKTTRLALRPPGRPPGGPERGGECVLGTCSWSDVKSILKGSSQCVNVIPLLNEKSVVAIPLFRVVVIPVVAIPRFV